MSKTFNITLSDAQYKALTVVTVNPEEWINNAVQVRCDGAIDDIVKQEIDRKLSLGETISGTKEQIVINAVVETAAEKQAKYEEEMAAEQAARQEALNTQASE